MRQELIDQFIKYFEDSKKGLIGKDARDIAKSGARTILKMFPTHSKVELVMDFFGKFRARELTKGIHKKIASDYIGYLETFLEVRLEKEERDFVMERVYKSLLRALMTEYIKGIDEAYKGMRN